MATIIQAAVSLYIETVRKWKTKAEDSVISQGAFSGDQVYVGGVPYDYDSLSPGRLVDGDAVMVARSDTNGKVVVLG